MPILDSLKRASPAQTELRHHGTDGNEKLLRMAMAFKTTGEAKQQGFISTERLRGKIYISSTSAGPLQLESLNNATRATRINLQLSFFFSLLVRIQLKIKTGVRLKVSRWQ